MDVVSHIQIRGSVPVYWQQAGPVSPPMLSCPVDSSNTVFMTHMNYIKKIYGGNCFIFNLLSESRSGEPSLSQAWRDMIQKNNLQQEVGYLHVDFHDVTKGNDFKSINKYISDYNQI